MGLLKKGNKKPLRSLGRGGAAAAAQSTARPQQAEKIPPCVSTCPSGSDIRGWIETVALREKMGLSEEEAFTRAWNMIVETNPFPAIMGRVCPHPCENGCNRVHKDGSVAINSLERFLGDWALERKLPLPKLAEGKKDESIGVIGAGPAGLSFAYQMARRGYPVTVYEAFPKAGGMLLYGIPVYRLPEDVLEAEIQRILNVGVELKLNTVVGKDVSVEELRKRHKIVFLGIGAHKGKLMKVEGEQGPGVWTGTDYLHRVNRGEGVDVGKSVAVIGGGDTAVDAARVARRTGADVTILYRRTRKEMPAIDSEVEDAILEEVKIDFLVAPVAVKRDTSGKLQAILVQRMELGEPDSSGRRRPVPLVGSEYEIKVDTIIAAISQQADWDPLPEIAPPSGWLKPDDTGKIDENLWAGGDVIDLGIATTAIAHGRRAAQAAHAKLSGQEPPVEAKLSPINIERMKLEHYEEKKPAERKRLPVADWLKRPNAEIDSGIDNEQCLAEAARCMSCGLCFGCENCWMYCTPSCFSKVKDVSPGSFYTINLDTCDGCDKCAEVCPCGFLDMI